MFFSFPKVVSFWVHVSTQQIHVSTFAFEGVNKHAGKYHWADGRNFVGQFGMPSGWGHQGFTIVPEGFHFLVLWDVYLLKQTICWLLELKVFRTNHMKCFLICFGPLRDMMVPFFVTKGVAVISSFNYVMLINVACLVVFPLLLFLAVEPSHLA